MHPTDVDPGVTLAGRYRVAELLAEAPSDGGGVAQTWRAVDEILSRSVVIHILAADDPRADGMLEASRRAATVADVRFLRVLDALREDGLAYVVREWVQGRSLAELLSDGPLPPRDAGLIIREVAEALSRAHEQKLFHERLDPDSVVVTDGGTIKIVGLATQVALGSPSGSSVDPAKADSVGLGRLLYAALTARWPTGPRSGLAAGPRAADGTLLSPRQCRAGVPRALDEIVERVLSDRPRHGSPLGTPREIVDALTGTVGTTPPEGVLASSRASIAPTPFLAGPPAPDPRPQQQPSPAGAAATAPIPASRPRPQAPRPMPAGQRPPGGPPRPRPPQRPYRPQEQPASGWSRIAIVVVSLVFLAGLGLLGWQLVKSAVSPGAGGTQSPNPSSSGAQSTDPGETPTANPGKPYSIAGSGSFDPLPKGSGDENPTKVTLAYDGKLDTLWTTKSYKTDFTKQKPGVGIWVDLGQDEQVGNIDLSMLGEGSTVEIRVAPEGSEEAPSVLDDWQKVGGASGLGSQTTPVKLDKPVKTRFVLIWLTEVPQEGSDWRGGIAEVVVRP